jgi:hypothetical protein
MKKKLDWASTEDYKAVFKHLDERQLDTENEYFYVELLESQGKAVFRKDLREWMS